MSKKLTAAIVLLVVIVLLVITGKHFIRAGDDSLQDKSGNTESIARIHVEDCRIANDSGRTVQLTGMSTHGLLWYPQYTNAGAMQTLKDYGANTIRIAAYSDDVSGGYVQNPNETMHFMYTAIENAIHTGMYIIVDWHVLEDGNPLLNRNSALAFFEEISGHYGNCPNILYEICNEPNGSATWDDIYEYAGQVIPVIRNHAPDSIILVGTPDYSYSVEKVFDKPLDFENVMYSFHFYAGQHDDHYNEVFDLCDKNNIPVFVSEWGVNNGEDGQPALSQAETFVTVMKRRKISWTAWSLSNKEEVFSSIQPDCWKFSSWSPDDLTDVGKLFFRSFQ